MKKEMRKVLGHHRAFLGDAMRATTTAKTWVEMRETLRTMFHAELKHLNEVQRELIAAMDDEMPPEKSQAEVFEAPLAEADDEEFYEDPVWDKPIA